MRLLWPKSRRGVLASSSEDVEELLAVDVELLVELVVDLSE